MNHANIIDRLAEAKNNLDRAGIVTELFSSSEMLFNAIANYPVGDVVTHSDALGIISEMQGIAARGLSLLENGEIGMTGICAALEGIASSKRNRYRNIAREMLDAYTTGMADRINGAGEFDDD